MLQYVNVLYFLQALNFALRTQGTRCSQARAGGGRSNHEFYYIDGEGLHGCIGW